MWRIKQRKMDGGYKMKRDMAHLLLLFGGCEIAGFPRSAKCGSEFFHCLSPLPPIHLCSALSPLPSLFPCLAPLSHSHGLTFYFISDFTLCSFILSVDSLLHRPPMSVMLEDLGGGRNKTMVSLKRDGRCLRQWNTVYLLLLHTVVNPFHELTTANTLSSNLECSFFFFFPY